MTTIRNRKESIIINNVEYTLTLEWSEKDLRECAFGITPNWAHIEKNGVYYAKITDCYSNCDGFSVKEVLYPIKFFPKDDEYWEVFFKENIHTISFKEILNRIPL